MALTPAEKQRRYRERLKAADQTNPDAIERELLQEVARCERGEMSDQERIALPEKLADLAMDLLWRSHMLSRMATKLRTGEDHSLATVAPSAERERHRTSLIQEVSRRLKPARTSSGETPGQRATIATDVTSFPSSILVSR